MEDRQYCPERKRLEEALRVATRELQCLLAEECRVVLNDATDLIGFEAVVQDGEARWQTALETYRRHVAVHGCDAKVLTAGSSPYEF